MKKPILALLLVGALAISSCTTIFAYEQEPEYAVCYQTEDMTIKTNSRALDQKDIQELSQLAEVLIECEDGSKIPVDTQMIVTELPSTLRTSVQGTQYQISVLGTARKSESGSADYNKNSVSASIHLTMTWTDVFGTANTIDYLSGQVNVSSGDLQNTQYRYGSGLSGVAGSGRPSGSTFDTSINYTTDTGRVWADYRASFVQTGANFVLNVSVNPSILD